MNWLQTNLRFFTSLQRQNLVNTVTEERFYSLPLDAQNDIIYLFTRITAQTSRVSLDNIYDALVRAVLYDGLVKVFRVNEGEDFSLNIEKYPQDNYTGFMIVARENKTNQILSEIKEGTDDSIQSLKFTDLDLEAGEFFKVRVQLEIPDGGGTAGDATTLLCSVYFIVGLDLDAN